MEIFKSTTSEGLLVKLRGRLDATWSEDTQAALEASVREGVDRITVDMSEVAFLSSAGIRVLIVLYQSLHGIGGRFLVARPSDSVREVLALSGLDQLLAPGGDTPPPMPVAETAGPVATEQAAFGPVEIFALAHDGARLSGQVEGDPSRFAGGSYGPGDCRRMTWAGDQTGLGLGAFGTDFADCQARFGDFLAVGGVAIAQAPGGGRPDFVATQESLVPELEVLHAVTGAGAFARLARFHAEGAGDRAGLAELSALALRLARADTALAVLVAETTGLVGAALRRSPTEPAPEGGRFAFPGVREWLSFTAERAWRDHLCLAVGLVCRRAGGVAGPFLAPLGAGDLHGHWHAAAFPGRPLRQGRINLLETVADLLRGAAPLAVLHLLADRRPGTGAGESEFSRGALWAAPFDL